LLKLKLLKMTRENYGQAYQRGFECTVRFLLSRGIHRDTANESAQAAWARGWERLSQLRDEGMVVTWVNMIALNVFRGVVRRENGPTVGKLSETTAIDLAAIDLARILKSCRPSDRILLEQQLHGYSAKEIAVDQGVSATAIRIRLLRARRKAREVILNRSLPLADALQAVADA
jgi:DNA-directed RNA polymerase specialized sigma24 family protein